MRTWLHEGLPARLEHGGRIRTVAHILDVWRVGTRWWRGEAPSTHYLLELEDEVTVEIREQGGSWRLLRVMD